VRSIKICGYQASPPRLQSEARLQPQSSLFGYLLRLLSPDVVLISRLPVRKVKLFSQPPWALQRVFSESFVPCSTLHEKGTTSTTSARNRLLSTISSFQDDFVLNLLLSLPLVPPSLFSRQTVVSQLHLDEKSGNYYDFGNHTEKVELTFVERRDPSSGVVYGREMVRKTTGKPRPRFVPHYGYNSLFPLLMRLFPAVSGMSHLWMICLFEVVEVMLCLHIVFKISLY
jgi:hypothetical protein